MNHNEIGNIYSAYTGREEEAIVDDASTAYLNDLVPLAKEWGIVGIQRYLTSQGISDPEAIRYIQQKIK